MSVYHQFCVFLIYLDAVNLHCLFYGIYYVSIHILNVHIFSCSRFILVQIEVQIILKCFCVVGRGPLLIHCLSHYLPTMNIFDLTILCSLPMEKLFKADYFFCSFLLRLFIKGLLPSLTLINITFHSSRRPRVVMNAEKQDQWSRKEIHSLQCCIFISLILAKNLI